MSPTLARSLAAEFVGTMLLVLIAVGSAVVGIQTIGPAAVALREMDEADRGRTLEAIREVVIAHCRDGMVAMRAAVWIVAAARA